GGRRRRTQGACAARVARGGGGGVGGAPMAQGGIDDEKVGRRAARGDLPRRCEAEQEPTSAGKHFFGNQHSKWRADSTANNSYRLPRQFKAIQLCVIARPELKRL